MSISTLDSTQTRRELDAIWRRSAAVNRAEADLAFDFEQAIAAGEPDRTPDWTGTVPDSRTAQALGIQHGAANYPRKRVTVAEALAESLDYQNGPDMGDVLKVLSLAMRGTDPMVALAAQQLVQRAARKYAQINCPEVEW